MPLIDFSGLRITLALTPGDTVGRWYPKLKQFDRAPHNSWESPDNRRDFRSVAEALREYYGGMLKLGATTFWEDFDLRWTLDENGVYDANPIDELVPEGKKDIHADFGKHCYVGLRHSFCHGWSSAVAAFLANYVLGVRILEPGCRRVEIKPQLCGLDYVRGSFPTPFGKISIYADKDGVKLDVPDGVEAVR